MVASFDGCSIEQIQRRFFPTPGARSACYRRLALLIEAGYLRAARILAAPASVFGKAFITVGPSAREILRSQLLLEPREVRRFAARAVPTTAAHDLAINDVHLALELACRGSSRVSLESWTSEWELRSTPRKVLDPVLQRQVPVIPDAGFTLSLGGSALQRFFLELDRNTYPTPERFGAKLRALIVLAGETLTPVLFVTTDEKRARHILAQAKGLEANPTWIWVTTLDRVSERTILSEPIWAIAGEGGGHPLVPPEQGDSA